MADTKDQRQEIGLRNWNKNLRGEWQKMMWRWKGGTILFWVLQVVTRKEWMKPTFVLECSYKNFWFLEASWRRKTSVLSQGNIKRKTKCNDLKKKKPKKQKQNETKKPTKPPVKNQIKSNNNKINSISHLLIWVLACCF